jgi:hypothetical protein
MAGAGDDFGQHFTALLAAAKRRPTLLRRFDDDGWASWLDEEASQVKRGDEYGLDHLLTAFGGWAA